MTLFPYITLFASTLILGSMLALSGTHWIFIWMGLELNLMSFIPLLTHSSLNQEAEAAMKYFLAQALGSGLLLLGALSLYSFPHVIINTGVLKMTIVVALLIKLGLPPCHFWFPSVMSLISWPLCMILATWQKLIPMLIICYMVSPSFSYMFISIVVLSSFTGGLGGINQTQLRPILAYSSIGHMSWMLAAGMVSFTASMMYLVTYIIITIPLMMMLSKKSMFMVSSLNNLSNLNNLFYFGVVIMILSLGGVPPFLGFFPKWMVLESLSSLSASLTIVILLGSMINLYYYLNLVFISFMKTNKLIYSAHSPSFTMSPMIILSTLTLGIGPLLFSIFYAMIILH